MTQPLSGADARAREVLARELGAIPEADDLRAYRAVMVSGSIAIRAMIAFAQQSAPPASEVRAAVLEAVERNWNAGPDALTDAILALPPSSGAAQQDAGELSRYHFTDENPFVVTTSEGDVKLGKGWLAITEEEYAAIAQQGMEARHDEEVFSVFRQADIEAEKLATPTTSSGREEELRAAIVAYNAVWESATNITAANVEAIREEAMRAALAARTATEGVVS